MAPGFPALPGLRRQLGRLFYREPVRIAAVMVHVVHQRHALRSADWQEVGWRELPVIVLKRDSLAGPAAQPIQAPPQAIESSGNPIDSASTVQHDGVGSDQSGQGALQLQLRHRPGRHSLMCRVQDHELIRMKAQSHVVLAGEIAGERKGGLDLSGGIQALERVATLGMSCQRQDLAGDAKGTDAELMTSFHRGDQRLRVVPGDVGEVSLPAPRLETRDISVGGGSELDGRVEEVTAKSPANHEKRLTNDTSTPSPELHRFRNFAKLKHGEHGKDTETRKKPAQHVEVVREFSVNSTPADFKLTR